MYMLLTQQQKSVGVLNTVGEWLLKPRRQRHSLGICIAACIAACAACCVGMFDTWLKGLGIWASCFLSRLELVCAAADTTAAALRCRAFWCLTLGPGLGSIAVADTTAAAVVCCIAL